MTGIERLIWPLDGEGLTVTYKSKDEAGSHNLRGRKSVFHGTTDLVYLPINTEISITGSGRVIVAEAPAKNHKPVKFIAKDAFPNSIRGAGPESRQIHDFGGVAALDGQAVSAVAVVGGWILAAQADLKVAVLKAADLSVVHRTEPLPGAVTALSAELAGGRAAALLADGSIRLLATAADTGAITVAAEIRSDAGPITRISGGGPQLLTVAAGKVVQLWKSEDGTQAARFETPAEITAVDARPAAERAVFVFGGSAASLWSIKENKELAALTANLPAQRDQKNAEIGRAHV